MARPKGSVNKSYVGLRMNDDLIKKVDDFGKNWGLLRSNIVNDAVEHYVNSKPCIICGTMNPSEGKHCAVCGSELFSYEDIEKKIEKMLLLKEFWSHDRKS